MRWSPEQNRQPRKLLIVQLRGVGDVVLVTPTLDAIRAAWPQARVHWLTDPSTPSLFGGDPRIDLFWIRSGDTRQVRLARNLRRERFDLVLDLQSLPITAMISKATGGYVVGFAKRGRGLFQDRSVVLDDHRGTGYTADHKLDLLRAVGLTPTLGTPRLVAAPRPHPVWNGHGPGRRVALVPTSHLDHKRWAPQAFARVADGLRSRGADCVLCGGPGEGDQLEAVASFMQAPPPQRALAADLAGFKCVLGGADLFIGNDTGPRHIAAALGLPTIGWFDTPNPANWTPMDATRHPVIWDRDKAAGRPLRSDLVVLPEDPEAVIRAATGLLPGLTAANESR